MEMIVYCVRIDGAGQIRRRPRHPDSYWRNWAPLMGKVPKCRGQSLILAVRCTALMKMLCPTPTPKGHNQTVRTVRRPHQQGSRACLLCYASCRSRVKVPGKEILKRSRASAVLRHDSLDAAVIARLGLMAAVNRWRCFGVARHSWSLRYGLTCAFAGVLIFCLLGYCVDTPERYLYIP